MIMRMTREEITAERLRMDARARRSDRIVRLEDRVQVLQTALADARRDHADLVGLVERMGQALNWNELEHGKASQWPYTVIGQREYDAAMHEAEGPDVRREDCVP